MTSAVIVSLKVRATPLRAFAVFTAEIDQWWQPNTLFPLTPRGDGALRFERPEGAGTTEGGRLVTQLKNGKRFEVGRILAWVPGERVVFTWRQAIFPPDLQTEVEVSFEAVGEETRVTIEHRGWDRVPQEHVARHGFPLEITQQRLGEHMHQLLRALRAHILSTPAADAKKARPLSGDHA
ncbi:MAG: SRPBCC domain-containing protein [Alphaproteobacteria bacterium]